MSHPLSGFSVRDDIAEMVNDRYRNPQQLSRKIAPFLIALMAAGIVAIGAAGRFEAPKGILDGAATVEREREDRRRAEVASFRITSGKIYWVGGPKPKSEREKNAGGK